jgi:hypothetical protein
MALIVQADLEARLGRTLSNDETTDFVLINAANQVYVERMIGSSLETASEATRYYDGGVQYLSINPCTDITAVKLVDEDQAVVETVDTSDYTKEPINKTLKTMVRCRYGRFYRGINNMAVTAKYSIAGDTDTVNIVKSAMLDALASEIDNSETIIKESIEGYSVEKAKPESKSLLDKIKFLFPEVI